MKPIEADPYHISLYLVYLSHTCSSSAPIISAISAISWAHRIAGANDPTQMPLVKYTSEGLKRSLAKPIEKKEPITPAILRDIVDMQLKQSSEITVADLSSLRTVAMCLLAYTGFLRFNELVSIKLSHITFNQQGLTLFIPSSKTDIYHGGRSVVISKSYTRYCPVEILNKYILLAQIKIPDSFLFRSLSKVKGGYTL